MNAIKLYHGTNFLFSKIDLQKSRDKRDFGKGFYTTTIFEQAAFWAKNVFARYGGKNKIVMQFEFFPNENLKIKTFRGMTKEWLKFVKTNRINGGVNHDFDVVIGPVETTTQCEQLCFMWRAFTQKKWQSNS